MKIDLILIRAFFAFSIIAVLLILGGVVAGSLFTFLLGVGSLFACFACGLLGVQRELTVPSV